MPTRINGNIYSWSSIEAEAFGIDFDGLVALDYDDGVETGMPTGQGSIPRGGTQGKWSGTGSCEMHRDLFDRWTKALGPGWSGQDHLLNVSYFEPVLGVIMDTLLIRLSKQAVSNAEGSANGSTVKCTLSIMQPILWDGVPCILPS